MPEIYDNLQPGQIVRPDFAIYDNVIMKRPVMVLGKLGVNRYLVAPFTTQNGNGKPRPFYELVKRDNINGLAADSYLKTDQIYYIDNDKIYSVLGIIDDPIQRRKLIAKCAAICSNVFAKGLPQTGTEMTAPTNLSGGTNDSPPTKLIPPDSLKVPPTPPAAKPKKTVVNAPPPPKPLLPPPPKEKVDDLNGYKPRSRNGHNMVSLFRREITWFEAPIKTNARSTQSSLNQIADILKFEITTYESTNDTIVVQRKENP